MIDFRVHDTGCYTFQVIDENLTPLLLSFALDYDWMLDIPLNLERAVKLLLRILFLVYCNSCHAQNKLAVINLHVLVFAC